MSTNNIPFLIKKENYPRLSQICSDGTFSKGLKHEFQTAVVNEPSVFEPLKFYCRNEGSHVCVFCFFFLLRNISNCL